MKVNTCWLIGLVACGGLGLTQPGLAQHSQPRFYAWGDLGTTIMEDTGLDRFLAQNMEGAEVKFDLGFRMGMGMGCEFNRWLAAEFETGFTWNSIESITDASYVRASLYQVPILVNVKAQFPFELPNRSKLVPMLGGGLGGVGVSLDMDEITIGSDTAWGTAYDFVFAYQGLAGFRYELNDQMSIGVYYRYFVADAPTFDPDVLYYTYGNIQMEALHSHQVSLGFTWRF